MLGAWSAVKKRLLSPIGCIYFLFSAGSVAMLLSLVISRGEFLERIVYNFSHFVDFYDHVRRFYLDLNMVYDEGMHASFPPLAYILYYFVACILYKDNVGKPDELSKSGSGMLVFSMFLVVFTALFFSIFLSMCKLKKEGMKKCLAVMLLISYPFWLAIERGNMSLLVLLILMLAITWKDSETRWKKEMALILFAIAAGLKLYPAIFGILYLTERRFREAGRLVLYGLFFFFAPFVFFHGIDGFKAFYRNISAVGSGATGVTIVGLVGRIGEKLGVGLAKGHMLGKWISYAYFLVVIVICFFSKKAWKKILLLTSLMIIFVAASGTYCLIYTVIPFICFVNEMSTKEYFCVLDYIHAILFSLVFMAYPIQMLGSSGMLYIALYLLLMIAIVEEIIQGIRKRGFS